MKKSTNASRIVYERMYHFLRFKDHANNKENPLPAWKKWAKKYALESMEMWAKYDMHAANMAAKSYLTRSSVSQHKETK